MYFIWALWWFDVGLALLCDLGMFYFMYVLLITSLERSSHTALQGDSTQVRDRLTIGRLAPPNSPDSRRGQRWVHGRHSTASHIATLLSPDNDHVRRTDVHGAEHVGLHHGPLHPALDYVWLPNHS